MCSCSLFSDNVTILKKPTRFLILNTELNKNSRPVAIWNDNIYGKWTGLAKQHPEKYVYHDYLPFIAQPPGRVLIRAAKEEKSINSSCTWGLYHLHSESGWKHFEKRSSLFSLFKQKSVKNGQKIHFGSRVRSNCKSWMLAIVLALPQRHGAATWVDVLEHSSKL